MLKRALFFGKQIKFQLRNAGHLQFTSRLKFFKRLGVPFVKQDFHDGVAGIQRQPLPRWFPVYRGLDIQQTAPKSDEPPVKVVRLGSLTGEHRLGIERQYLARIDIHRLRLAGGANLANYRSRQSRHSPAHIHKTGHLHAIAQLQIFQRQRLHAH